MSISLYRFACTLVKREDENNEGILTMRPPVISRDQAEETTKLKEERNSSNKIFKSQNLGGGFGNYFSTMKQQQVLIVEFRLLSQHFLRPDQSDIRRDVGTWQSASLAPVSPLRPPPPPANLPRYVQLQL